MTANHSIFGTVAEGMDASGFTTKTQRHKKIKEWFCRLPDWLAAEASGKTGRSSVVAPVFTRSRGNPKASQTPGGFLCFFLDRARKKRIKPFHRKSTKKIKGFDFHLD